MGTLNFTAMDLVQNGYKMGYSMDRLFALGRKYDLSAATVKFLVQRASGYKGWINEQGDPVEGAAWK